MRHSMSGTGRAGLVTMGLASSLFVAVASSIAVALSFRRSATPPLSPLAGMPAVLQSFSCERFGHVPMSRGLFRLEWPDQCFGGSRNC